MGTELRYLEHLTDTDLQTLAETGPYDGSAVDLQRAIGREPRLLDEILGSEHLFETVFERPETGLEVQVSPFLTFGILVYRAASDLDDVSYVPEWTAPGRRLPVFDVGSLRHVLDRADMRFFLVDLLASFTRVASGSRWVRTRRGYRRRRYSELDPVRLAEMVEELPPAQRPGGYRRLGDVVLFLAGVFPDHTARRPLPVRHRERLARSAGLSTLEAFGANGGLDFHESAGAGWYRRAVEEAAALVGRGPDHLLGVADEITDVRRALTFVADRYLNDIDSGLSRPA